MVSDMMKVEKLTGKPGMVTMITVNESSRRFVAHELHQAPSKDTD